MLNTEEEIQREKEAIEAKIAQLAEKATDPKDGKLYKSRLTDAEQWRYDEYHAELKGIGKVEHLVRQQRSELTVLEGMLESRLDRRDQLQREIDKLQAKKEENEAMIDDLEDAIERFRA